MPKKEKPILFLDYYEDWVEIYKVGLVAETTLQKYKQTIRWIGLLAPKLFLDDLDKREYQHIINEYAKTHEHQTVKDFHTHLKAAIMDAVDEGHLKVNPCRKVVIKGKEPRLKKIKYLSQEESRKLINTLDLDTPIKSEKSVNWDFLIFLCLKTGIRFAEALGLTPEDFDFPTRTISINKTLNYKCPNKVGEFQRTKTDGSVRKILLDYSTSFRFQQQLEELERDKSIFLISNERIFNSTINGAVTRACKLAGISEITIHGLRHTHASLLLVNGVSIPSIAKRLGHANVSTTQETYIHIIKELEEKDNDKIMMSLANLG